MAGTIIPLFSLRSFDFSDVSVGGTATTILIKEFDVSAWTEGTLNVRVHGGDFDASASAKISISLAATAPTAEDPAKHFIDSTAVANVDITSSTVGAAPVLSRDSLSSGFGGKLCLKVIGTQDTSSALANLNADLSAEIVLKD